MARGYRRINPYIRHTDTESFITDEFYEIRIEYVGDGTNTADDRLRALAERAVIALGTKGRRMKFFNWYSKHLVEKPII